jgi:hypothetical protein
MFRRVQPSRYQHKVLSMPIVMKMKKYRSCPMVVCDVCHKEIKDARQGNAQLR